MVSVAATAETIFHLKAFQSTAMATHFRFAPLTANQFQGSGQAATIFNGAQTAIAAIVRPIIHINPQQVRARVAVHRFSKEKAGHCPAYFFLMQLPIGNAYGSDDRGA